MILIVNTTKFMFAPRLVYQYFSNSRDLSKYQSDKKWQSLPIKISNYLSNYGAKAAQQGYFSHHLKEPQIV